MHRFSALLVLCLVASLAAACSSSSSTTPTTPTTTFVTDEFSGTIGANGAYTGSFLVIGAGDITLTITALTGDSTVVGLELGTSADGVVCQNVLSNDSARLNTQIVGRASGGPAAFCARIYDTGHLTDPVDFTLQVVHP
jgi:hypothetical protein